MPALTRAQDEQVEAIYRESHALWGSGLGFEDYLGLWHDLRRTAWGRRHADLWVWADDRGSALSSVKLYRPRLRVNGRTAGATVIGALFTPPARRGRGHASALVRAVLAQARERGDAVVMLFSDIGTDYYLDLGFHALPAREDWGTLPRDAGAPPGWSLQPMSDADLTTVRRAHDDFCRTRPFAVVRDAEHWEYLDLRAARFFERLRDGRFRQRRQIALERGRFAGYLLTVEGRGEWNIREVGAPGGSAEAMAITLRLGATQARRAGLRGFYGWLPPGVAPQLRDWPVHSRQRRRAVPMVRWLDAADVPPGIWTTADKAYLPYQDQF